MDGWINKQASRRPCGAGVGWQPSALAWANAASGTLSSNLFGCQMYLLGKQGSWVVTFQEMAQEEDSCSRRQAEKLSWVNVLQLCAEVRLTRDFTSPHAFHYCLEVSPAWPALFLLCEQDSCQDFLKSALRQQISFFLLHRVFLTLKKPFMSQMQLPTGTTLQEKTQKNEVRR